MKKLIRKILWKEYRMTVYYYGEAIPRQTYAKDGKLLRLMASHLPKNCSWTIYKKGPFGLGEREVACGNFKAACVKDTRKESE